MGLGQAGGDLGHRARPIGRIEAQAPLQQVGEFAGHGRQSGFPRPVGAVGRQRFSRDRPGHPGDPAGEHLQHRDREAVDVGAPAQRLARALLRRGVRTCQATGGDQHADAGRALVCGHRHGDRTSPGQPEVGHLRGALLVDQDVGGLHVLVYQATAVRVLEAPRDLDRQVRDAGECFAFGASVQPAVVDPVTQAAARHVLGEYPGNTADRADVVAGAHVRVQPQRHPYLGLGDEPLAVGRAAEQLRAGAFHREICAPQQVPDPVNQPHPAVLVHPRHFVPAVDDVTDLPQRQGLCGLAHQQTVS